MAEYDKGPPQRFARIFATLPDFRPYRQNVWFDWGPIFYRGRLDGSARLICVASDPGPTERIAGRTLVGNAGQRVQGFLRKIGVTSSYVCVNAIAYAFKPGDSQFADDLIAEPVHAAWFRRLMNALDGPQVQAVIAFGRNAQQATEQWKPCDPRRVQIAHPSSATGKSIPRGWKQAVPTLRTMVAPDPDGFPLPSNYGTEFREQDYAAIPAADLPFGVPSWLGDDSWVRVGRGMNAVKRDSERKLIWTAPPAP